MNRLSLLKPLTLLWMLLVMALHTPTHAYLPSDYYRCTREASIVDALGILETSSAHDATTYLVENGTRILFKNMQELDKPYRNHDALSIITHDNHHVIFINSKHRTAPAPALAALISHEVLHADTENSLQEETSAWSREAHTWQEMLQRYPELRRIGLRQFPLVDRLNAVTLLVQQNRLEQEIRQNVAYHGLPQHSPGF